MKPSFSLISDHSDCQYCLTLIKILDFYILTLKRKVRFSFAPPLCGIILVMNSGHTLNIKFPCNLGISCNNSINLNSCFSEKNACFSE